MRVIPPAKALLLPQDHVPALHEESNPAWQEAWAHHTPSRALRGRFTLSTRRAPRPHNLVEEAALRGRSPSVGQTVLLRPESSHPVLLLPLLPKNASPCSLGAKSTRRGRQLQPDQFWQLTLTCKDTCRDEGIQSRILEPFQRHLISLTMARFCKVFLFTLCLLETLNHSQHYNLWLRFCVLVNNLSCTGCETFMTGLTLCGFSTAAL